ncbi:hypothetical protein TIFTF001_021978 [Ficus carica]|uniref:Uncharacterized protein n=1 Tax=Ficus carica TaxID=3494 RepID=A0AA88DCG6_FICCA|nr:hypothetical protein TIFTF001_021978 [Ficus carica]
MVALSSSLPPPPVTFVDYEHQINNPRNKNQGVAAFEDHLSSSFDYDLKALPGKAIYSPNAEYQFLFFYDFHRNPPPSPSFAGIH